MKVVILGSGVIGTTSAWYLAEAGHEVTVLDRQPGPALETSFANAGEVSPGYASPWAAPGIPVKAMKWLFMKHSPLFIRPEPRPGHAALRPAMLRNCTAAAYEVNKSRMVPIAEYSRDLLRALRAETGIAYDERARARSSSSAPRSCSTARPRTSPSSPTRRAHEVLDVDGCIRAEPALARVRGEVRRRPAPARRRDRRLLQVHRGAAPTSPPARGVEFRYGATITGLVADGGRVTGVATGRAGDGRRLRRRARQLLAAAAEAARHRPAGLSGQGLLADRADHRPRRRARSRR